MHDTDIPRLLKQKFVRLFLNAISRLIIENANGFLFSTEPERFIANNISGTEHAIIANLHNIDEYVNEYATRVKKNWFYLPILIILTLVSGQRV